MELTGQVATCQTCGKKCYRSKKSAKSNARRIYPGQRSRFYQCAGSEYWHITSQSSARTAAWRDFKASAS